MVAFGIGFLLLAVDILLLWLFFRRWFVAGIAPRSAKQGKLLVVLMFSKIAVLGVGVYFSLVFLQQDILYFTMGALFGLGAVVFMCVVADKQLYSKRVLR
ncbi:MAG: hypothetical protein OYH77_07635 [Pseudomonadota bacterium]|nr:hypothetical protein [Pseudomonadota bacterium]